MRVLYDVLYILAAVCFLLGSFGWSYAYRRSGTDAATAAPITRSFNPVSFGLFLWVLVPLIISLRAG